MLKKYSSFIALMLVCSLFFVKCLYSINLTVDTGVEGAMVAAMNFVDNQPSNNSVFGLTGVDGRVVLTIQPNVNYIVHATKQGYAPTLRDQMFMQKAVPVNTPIDKTISLLLTSMGATASVGQIKVGLVNVSTGAAIMGDVRNMATSESAAFVLGYLDSSLSYTSTNYIYINNVPPADVNKYVINIFSPKDNKALNKQIPDAIAAGGEVTVFMDFANREAMAAQTQDTGVTPEGNLAFEGVVVDTNSAGIPNFNVRLEGRAEGSGSPDCQFQTQTDTNGRFTFYNVPTGKYYEINVNGFGYSGVFDFPRSMGGDQQDSPPVCGYLYDGSHKIVVPYDPYNTYGAPVMNYGANHTKYELTAINGRLDGVVKIGGTPLPFAEVMLNSDGDLWQGYDMYASTRDNFGLFSPTNARIRTGSDGTFSLVGVSPGNLQLSINSDLLGTQFIYNFNGDWNARDMDNITRVRGGDDKRVVVSTEAPASAAQALWSVYCSSGGRLPSVSYPNRITINIQTGGETTCTIKGTIKFLDDSVVYSTNPVVVIAREQFMGDWANHKSKSQFQTISGTFAKGSTTEYSISVASGTQYFIDVQSEYLGIVNRMDSQANFTGVETGEKIFDFALSPAGKIKGVVRMPDGTIFKPVFMNYNTQGRRINIQARSNTSGGGCSIPESGMFELTGLVSGLYNVTIWGEGPAYYWPRTITIKDVMVSANKDTYLEIPLPSAAKCEAIAPTMPQMPAGTTGYYYIVGFPSDQVLTGKKIDLIMESDSDTPISFNYRISKITSQGTWQPTLAVPGRYNLYLIKYELFGDPNAPPPSQMEIEEGRPMTSNHQTITVISQAKNVEIKYDFLQPNATTYIPFEGAVTGKGKLTGTIKGENIFTISNFEKIGKEGMETALRYIPTVMLYDISGNWRGFSGARPPTENIRKWKTFFEHPDEVTKKALADSPGNYYIDMLPPGKYIMIAETPNYPPFMKEVVIYSTATTTLDLDFDTAVGSGISISGAITSTDNIKLEGVEVSLIHKSVDKYTTTDSSGNYKLTGLPKGIYKILVSAPGYALTGDKIGLNDDLKNEDFQLTKADAQLNGVVYSQKLPFAKTIANAKIACYDETYNTQNPTKYLPVYKAKTNKNGEYYISNLIAGHIYKIYVMYPGKIVEYVEKTPVAGDNIQDFELKSLPPKLKIIVKKTEDPRKFLFLFESPKKLVAPPECWYNIGDSYDDAKATQGLPLSGPNNTYSLYVKLLDISLNQSYNMRVISDDGSGTKYTEDIRFGGNVMRQAKKEVAEGIAEGDNVNIDELGEDNTQVDMDAGSLTATETSASSPGRGAPSFAIGGFSSNIPSFKLQGTDDSLASQLVNIIEDVVASDVYQVDLADAQMNKSITLTLNYDKEKVSEGDLEKLKLYQYNSENRVWELVPGVKTTDPVSGTVSIGVDSITEAYKSTSTSTRLAGKAIISNGRFVVNRAAATSQTGIFALFKSQPPTNVAWTGEFDIFNFPNPFNLKDKTVTLTNGGALGLNLSTRGTIIKYCLPSSLGSSVHAKFYIYNIAGELVREIDDGIRSGGYVYYLDWDGKNDSGDDCASGVYFLIAKAGNKTINKRKPFKLAIVK